MLKNLRELRLIKGISQRKLARISGLYHPAISQIEAGKRFPTYRTMQKLAKALNVEVTDLFS